MKCAETPSQTVLRADLSLGLGEVVLVEKPSVVRTVLGSCVAVILCVPRLALSALCHAQMPERRGNASGCASDCRRPCAISLTIPQELCFVTCCVRSMLDQLEQRGVCGDEIVATVVGGANVVPGIGDRWSVAARNVHVARAMLASEGIPIAFADTGGVHGRVIRYYSDLNRTEIRYHAFKEQRLSAGAGARRTT